MRRLLTTLLCLALMAAMAVPACALEYSFDAPSGPAFAKPTSIQPVVTADKGEMPNLNMSKDTALVPPAFGSAGTLIGGTVIHRSSTVIISSAPVTTAPSTNYTEVTPDFYYSGGSLGTLKIPSLGVDVKIFEGTDAAQLAKGAGHFEETSIWNGNCCIAAHNRGVNAYFGQIHTLNAGDKITLTTKLGTRTYEVVSVSKVAETDRSGLTSSTDNKLTLYTCVRDQSAYRWCVVAREVR